ncbi:META domain-containing protein [Photobacterium sp. 1_MG-2023]|uniref:META domain-containing protein n=1 Tax=Photobacterium sp. 1_MG-2023 TaxID=3062646 RepID=UPI0026E36994|nr:META domain-containing protein [Photobacterium sp. 1_MG-2023]MDO6705912.1 META domain-containing protein [Photobacterium sp. 1_MG-2023]
MKKWIWLSICLSMLGCNPPPKAGFTATDLQQDWVLSKIDGRELTQTEIREPIRLSLDGQFKATGFSGCNQFMGIAELQNGNQFRVTSLVSTKMACIQNEVAMIESVVVSSLQQWNTTALESNTLTLTTEQHVLTYIPEALHTPSDTAP